MITTTRTYASSSVCVTTSTALPSLFQCNATRYSQSGEDERERERARETDSLRVRVSIGSIPTLDAEWMQCTRRRRYIPVHGRSSWRSSRCQCSGTRAIGSTLAGLPHCTTLHCQFHRARERHTHRSTRTLLLGDKSTKSIRRGAGGDRKLRDAWSLREAVSASVQRDREKDREKSCTAL